MGATQTYLVSFSDGRRLAVQAVDHADARRRAYRVERAAAIASIELSA